MSLQIESKKDPVRESEAREWLQAVVGEPFPEGSFHEALKDGVFLCKTMQQLNPGFHIKINNKGTAFGMVSVSFYCWAGNFNKHMHWRSRQTAPIYYNM